MLRASLRDTSARVAVGADRHGAATAVLRACAGANEAPPDVALLDDGFQHWRLHRDADVACVDAVGLWGAGRRVPAGPLREAPPAALRRAAAVVLHNWPLATAAQRAAALHALDAACAPHTLRLYSHLQPLPQLQLHRAAVARQVGDFGDATSFQPAVVPIEALRGAPALALSGLARPRALELQLYALGAAAVASVSVGDHERFSRNDLARAAAAAAELRARTGAAPWLVITAKDAARDEEVNEGALAPDALRAAGVECAGGAAVVLRGALRFVRRDMPYEDDVEGAAAMDALLANLLARTPQS